YKSDTLRDIVTQVISLANDSFLHNLLKQVLQVTHTEKTSVPMVVIANYYAKQTNWFQSLYALSPAEKREKIIGLSQLLSILAEHKTPTLIPGPIVLPSEGNNLNYSGQPGNYTLTVQIQSPDKNCAKHADWWEIVTPDGSLISRKLINTVSKDEQPFSSSISSVEIKDDQTVLIRAHFQGTYFSSNDLLVDDRLRSYVGGFHEKSGYADQALKGSIDEGFKIVRISENFAKWLEKKDPLPDPEMCQEA
ncbi:MAG: hypothetical protein AAFR31_18300, partial [Cyanobacteria bacterium J06627_8]